MTDEQLETTIRDRGLGISDTTITVEIRASGRREDDFEAVREAVQEVLDR